MKTLREAIVVVGIAALCALVVNWRLNPTPLPWVHEERPVQSASDTLLDAFMNTTGSQPTNAASTSATELVPSASTTMPALSHQDSIALRKAKADSVKKAQALLSSSATVAQSTGATGTQQTQNPQATQSTSTAAPENAVASPKLPISVSYEQILKLLANPSSVTFIDARKEEEHAKGAFAGSLSVDMLQFPADPEYRNKSMRLLYSIPKDKIIVAYCGGGNCELSHELCDVLIPMGFKKVFIYLGGWNEYTEKQGIKK